MKKITMMIFILSLTFISSCTTLTKARDKVLLIHTKHNLPQDHIEKIAKEIFSAWRFRSKLTWNYYRIKDRKYKKKLDEIKKMDISWSDKHKLAFSRIKYKAEKIDIIELPETTYRRGYGDCDELARLATYVCGNIIESDNKIYNFKEYHCQIEKRDQEAHIVSIYDNEDGSMLVFSNKDIEHYKNKDDYIKENKLIMVITLKDNFKYKSVEIY